MAIPADAHAFHEALHGGFVGKGPVGGDAKDAFGRGAFELVRWEECEVGAGKGEFFPGGFVSDGNFGKKDVARGSMESGEGWNLMSSVRVCPAASSRSRVWRET